MPRAFKFKIKVQGLLFVLGEGCSLGIGFISLHIDQGECEGRADLQDGELEFFG